LPPQPPPGFLIGREALFLTLGNAARTKEAAEPNFCLMFIFPILIIIYLKAFPLKPLISPRLHLNEHPVPHP